MEYYFIGQRELVTAFKMIGVQGCVAGNVEAAREAFKRATGFSLENTPVGGDSSKEVSVERLYPRVLILTEGVSDMLRQEVLEWQMTGKFPLIVEIPGLQGRLEGRQSLSDSIREAIGIRV